MKKTIPNKAYEIVMMVFAILSLVNIAGLWVTWNNANNAFGYVIGLIELLGLITLGVLVLFNERFVLRKHCIIHFGFAVGHLVFFVICWCLGGKEDKAAPALFTVLLIAITLVYLFLLFKDRILKKQGEYDLGGNTPKPVQQDNEAINETAKVEETKPVEEAKPEDKTTIISL